MTVSTGFYKKIYSWVTREGTEQVLFRPFQSNGNPYKSRVFLVGATMSPLLKVEENSVKLFADALVNEDLLEDLYHAELLAASREYKGSVQFAKWLHEQYGEQVVFTSVNAYQTNDVKELKHLKKEDPTQYDRGIEIFKEVLTEFQPEIIILQGATAVEQFKSLYEEHLVAYNPAVTKIQDLENEGAFAEMFYTNGEMVKIFATRSMSYFGKNGETFENFKGELGQIL